MRRRIEWAMNGPRSIRIPRLLDVAPGATSGLASRLAAVFDVSKVLVVSGGRASSAIADRAVAELEAAGSKVTVWPDVRGTLAEANRLLAAVDADTPTCMVAVGGGQPIDVAKLAATRACVDVVVVPTVLSHDGVASPVASLTYDDGVRRSLAAGMPAGVVIDLDVVRGAPASLLLAGVGDLVSNLTAVADWRLAHERGVEPIDEFAASVAASAALPALGWTWPLDDDALATLARGLVVSGLAMEVAGNSRPCSGAEHLVSHALDQILGPRARSHGEQVAIGALLTATLHGQFAEELRSLFERVGLPTRRAELPFDVDVLFEALRQGPHMRPGRFTVLDLAEHTDESLRDVAYEVFP